MWVKADPALSAKHLLPPQGPGNSEYSDPFDAQQELHGDGEAEALPENNGYMEPYDAQRVVAGKCSHGQPALIVPGTASTPGLVGRGPPALPLALPRSLAWWLGQGVELLGGRPPLRGGLMEGAAAPWQLLYLSQAQVHLAASGPL